MAPSLSRSRPLDPLPPMPRRQSCDRCHEQKVRCVTEGRDGALTLGGIAEESESSLAGHVVSSVPCVRCRKAGAVCIYSPQLRSGRPRLRREPAVPPPRKRARRVSRCSSSSSLSTSFSQSASPPASSRASTAAASSPGGIGLGINTTHLTDHAHEYPLNQVSPIPSPGATTPHCESGNHRGPGLATPLASHWQPSPYGSDGNQFMAGMCQLTPVSENTGASMIPCVPLYPNPVSNVTMGPDNVMGSYPWAFTTLPDCSLEEVAQINLRIHLAGRALLSSPSRALACLTSPAVNDIFDAACSLINVVDRFVLSKRPTTAPEPHGADKGQTATRYCTEDLFGSPTLPVSPAIDTALDSSICLMLHSCHQAVLGIFEELSASMLVDLAESPIPTPPRTPTDPSFFPPPQYGPQPTAMATLISNILGQLDRAFLPLASESKPRPVREQRSMSTPVVTFRQDSPECGAAAAAQGAKVGGFYEQQQQQQQQQHPGAGAWQKSGASPSPSPSHSLWSEMEQRQMRVGSQVKAVEGLLRQPASGL